MPIRPIDDRKFSATLDHPLIGRDPDELTGVESRILRAALNLERLQVAVLANLLSPERFVSVEFVTNWEKSKGRGYPTLLVHLLNRLDSAVGRLADRIVAQAEVHDGRKILRRPLGPRQIHQRLEDEAGGFDFTSSDLEQLDKGGGAIWQALADAVMYRAAFIASQDPRSNVRIVLDREPDPVVSPRAAEDYVAGVAQAAQKAAAVLQPEFSRLKTTTVPVITLGSHVLVVSMFGTLPPYSEVVDIQSALDDPAEWVRRYGVRMEDYFARGGSPVG